MTIARYCQRHLRRTLSVVGLVIGAAAWAGAACAQAQSFGLAGLADETPARALTCMTQAIAYEAGFEPLNGQQAVAEVILNRTHNPRFPASVCGVVYQGAERSTGCQFTFTCDGSLRRRLPDWVMDQARAVANVALTNQLPLQVGGSLNYHADYVLPRWAATMIRVTKIGRHIFYRPSGLSLAVGYVATRESEAAGAVAGDAPTPAASTRRPVQDFSLWGLGQPGSGPKATRPTG